MLAKKRISISGLVLKLLVAWALIAFVVYPVVSLLVQTFWHDGTLSTEVFGKVFSSARAVQSLKNSFILAFTLVVTVNVVGTLCVLFTEYWDIKGAKILRLSYMTSLIYSGVVLVAGYKYVYGETGLLTKLLLQVFPNMNPNWFVGYGAVVFVMTFSCTQNHMMFLKNAIHGLDYHTVEAAKNMGASGSTIFFKIVLPVLKPTFFAITILTFLTGLGAMSAPLIVGGEDFQTINPMIITFSRSTYSREVAAFLAIILGVATIILLAVFSQVEKKGNYISVSKTKAKLTKQKINNPILNAAAHFAAWFMFLIYMLPIVLIIIYSLAAALLAALASIICVRFVQKSTNKLNKLFEYGALIPWLLPSTLIALGLTMAYGAPNLLIFNKVLVGTTVILLIGYVVIKLPFSYRMIRAAFFAVDNDLEDAAKCMGASTFYTMRKVIIPVILPAVMSVVILNFNGLLSDYDLTAFLYHPLFQPLGIVVKAASDENASIDAKCMSFVYTVVLMILSSIALYFGQGNGMQAIRRWKQKRIEKKVYGGK